MVYNIGIELIFIFMNYNFVSHYSKGGVTIACGPTNKHKVEDFKTGRNIDGQLKQLIHRELAAMHGGWQACQKKYEQYGKVSSQGVADLVRKYLNPVFFDEYVIEKGYKDDVFDPLKPCKILETAQKKAFGSITKNLGSQWTRQFEKILWLHTSTQIQPELFKDDDVISQSLNVKPKSTKKTTTSNKSDLLVIASKVHELLEPLNDEDRSYVLSV
tara:strand:- start:71 stop:715 length:645 start_codon:yes stop_codon:yes gene_type:complete